MKTVCVGIDIGSTTIKSVVLNDGKLKSKIYMRHFSEIKESFEKVMNGLVEENPNSLFKIAISGSGGLSLANELEIMFIQEVIASTEAVNTYLQEIETVIELGGEDAKITFLKNGVEQRMNGTCAGGTGAFIDQMAALMKCTVQELNEKAKNYKRMYPIAARCGVFAKSDIQPLINEGAAKEDIAVSIFQSVVNQTIAGLACGRKIQGRVAFLGGPLTFLSELGVRFKETLKLSDENAIFPENGEYYVALGAALKAQDSFPISGEKLKEKIKIVSSFEEKEIQRSEPLFRDKKEMEEYKKENILPIERKKLKEYIGNIYLGIDAGSTTTKVVAIGEKYELLFERYGSNEGKPLEKVKEFLNDFYSEMNEECHIKNSTVTGYGEELIKKALGIDIGVVETVAHYKGANYFYPGVTFILDIGGQDMKCMRIKDGVIDDIMLNEACSSGCGSFIQGFAESLNIPVEEFGKMGTLSQKPVDLGSRCTVFMNSRVKQAQKEGAGVEDISAGLAYSVIKNALFKVIKIKDSSDMGDKVILQGGTFYNDSVLKAFEKVTGRAGKRPEICGLMGAFGAAIIALEEERKGLSTIRTLEEIKKISIDKREARCGLCENNCALTINLFDNGERLIIGNRCERGTGNKNIGQEIPNLMREKLNMLNTLKQEPRDYITSVGIPRALNIYENLPLWHYFFDELGIKVVLSDKSSKEIFQKGFESIPSESVCYPAKITHGHIQDLLDKDVDFIFYPSVVFENKEVSEANNNFNCPIVTSYPEAIKNNMNLGDMRFLNPFINLNHKNSVIKNMCECLAFLRIDDTKIKKAYERALIEYDKFYERYRNRGAEVLRDVESGKYKGIVLCGRPYHFDEEINHGIPELINSLGFAVLTEESVSHLGNLMRPIRVVDQWMYHTRLYETADLVGKTEGLNIIQLNSFGCGLDAVTTDMVEEILREYGKLYTMIKIDEISNLGAAKIRIRSLKYAIEEKGERKQKGAYEGYKRVVFTKAMKNTHTIIVPQMSPIHFELVEEAFKSEGYNLRVLHKSSKADVDVGLKYVNNDACFPSIITVGQIVNEIINGDVDPDKTAVMISQTGGGCRATNYIGFLRKALKDAGYGQIPVVSANAIGLEPNPGFKFKINVIRKGIMAVCLGDLFMKVLYRTRPYEKNEGECNKLHKKLDMKCKEVLKNGGVRDFSNLCKEIIEEFDRVPLKNIQKPRVGVVGEILVKYHPLANNNLVDVIEREGGEAVVPGLLEFFLYCGYNSKFKRKYLGMSKLNEIGGSISIKYIESYMNKINKYLQKSKRFHKIVSIEQLAKGAEEILSLGNMTGEGWFLTAEMVELIESGVSNIVCTQPFACLPNHVTGKGMIKALKNKYPDSNIVAIDYDPGASEVNQLNRIKLMMTVAFEKVANNFAVDEAAMTNE